MNSVVFNHAKNICPVYSAVICDDYQQVLNTCIYRLVEGISPSVTVTAVFASNAASPDEAVVLLYHRLIA